MSRLNLHLDNDFDPNRLGSLKEGCDPKTQNTKHIYSLFCEFLRAKFHFFNIGQYECQIPEFFADSKYKEYFF